MRRALLKSGVLLILGWAPWSSWAQQGQTTLHFGVITTTTVAETRAAWEPFFEAMRRQTKLDVRGLYPATYEQAVEAMVGNLAQLSWLSNKSALDCIERANVEVFAQLVDASGAPGYHALVITRADSRVASIDQLLGKPRTWRFAMGEPGSTSGSVMPGYALFMPRAIKPEEHFLSLQRGTHAQTLEAVLSGNAHAGVYNTEEMQRLRERSPADAAKLRVLWESALIPKDPLLWRRDLPLSVRNRLAGFLFNYGQRADEKQQLKLMFDLAGFQRSTNQQLKFVLDIEDFKLRSEVLLDPLLSEAERRERLADLGERYQRLSRAVQAALEPTR